LGIAEREDERKRGYPRGRAEVLSATSKISKDGSSGVLSVFIGLLAVTLLVNIPWGVGSHPSLLIKEASHEKKE
jgi:hypothetical protein